MDDWQHFWDSLAGASGSVAGGGYGVTLPGPGVIVTPQGGVVADPTSLTSMIGSDATSAGNGISDFVHSVIPDKSTIVVVVIGLFLVLLIMGKLEAI